MQGDVHPSPWRTDTQTDRQMFSFCSHLLHCPLAPQNYPNYEHMRRDAIYVGRPHPLAAHPRTELEDLDGRQQVGIVGGRDGGRWVGEGVQPQPWPTEVSPRPTVFNGKQGNGSADVSILESPEKVDNK